MINGEQVLKYKYSSLGEDIQVSGIDLRIGELYEFLNEDGLYGLFEDEKLNQKIRKVSYNGNFNDKKVWELLPHKPYLAEVVNDIEISEDSAQSYYPRSTLLRNGVTVHTAWGDTGYNGKLMFLIINNNDMSYYLEKNVRFVQLIDHQVYGAVGTYDGDYQHNKHMQKMEDR